MNVLHLRTNVSQLPEDVPFAVYTVGTELQTPITRLMGFSADQLMITFSGTGKFRLLKQDKWDIQHRGTALYIPAGMPHEYMPEGEAPWHVGFVTYTGKENGILNSWGFNHVPFTRQIQNPDRMLLLLTRIWTHSGPDHDLWTTTETLFSFFLELKKQMLEFSNSPKSLETRQTVRLTNSVVQRTVQFMQDHLERSMTMEEISAHFGYSLKQLTRLFRHDLKTTPLQYMQHIRMQAAIRLLLEHPNMTIRQIAAYVGMEPVYFTRLFRREYGKTPTAYRLGTEDVDLCARKSVYAQEIFIPSGKGDDQGTVPT
ncbi:MAG: helix-turn-helix transcriptional regulator [Gorillibacterium sp.]|nr:helix-turn-helix transcriptional regulator [Gorillibacterium sp.]